jgi:NDP-sugar pyrophosphorylase family protein
MFLEQAVILSGGRGERLRPFTDHAPKPLVPVNGAPFLDYLIESLKCAGIRRILLLLGYRSESMIERYGDLCHPALTLQFSIGAVEDQTGRRLLNAYESLDRHFMLLYADNYWPIEFDRMVTSYVSKAAPVSATVFRNSDGTGEYGWDNNVEVDREGFVVQYDKTRRSARLNGVDIGYFIVDKTALNPNAHGNVSFEEHLLPDFIRHRALSAYVTGGPYYYVTAMKDVRTFERVVAERNFQPI